MAEYIEREAVYQKLSRMIDYCKKDFTVRGLPVLFQVFDAVMDIPAADVEPVLQGRWVWQTGDLYMCTACNADCHVDECMNEPQYAFCPNCGAKMDLEGLE